MNIIASKEEIEKIALEKYPVKLIKHPNSSFTEINYDGNKDKREAFIEGFKECVKIINEGLKK